MNLDFCLLCSFILAHFYTTEIYLHTWECFLKTFLSLCFGIILCPQKRYTFYFLLLGPTSILLFNNSSKWFKMEKFHTKYFSHLDEIGTKHIILFQKLKVSIRSQLHAIRKLDPSAADSHLSHFYRSPSLSLCTHSLYSLCSLYCWMRKIKSFSPSPIYEILLPPWQLKSQCHSYFTEMFGKKPLTVHCFNIIGL